MSLQSAATPLPLPRTGSIKISKVGTEDDVFRHHLDQLVMTDSVQTMTITPAMAKIMLERNTGNRFLSQSRAAKYAKDMKEGNWKLTGEPIIFSDVGILNDGQTRLSACLLAGISFVSDVRFGIERVAFDVTNTGTRRTLADVFSIQKEENAIRLAGALNWLHRYEAGFNAPKLSHVDGQAMLAAHPDIRKSIKPGRQLYNSTHFIEPSLAIFLHYIFSLKDAEKAGLFFGYLEEGLGALSGDDPLYRIRERLIGNKGSKAKLPSIEVAALAIKAWNCFRRGQKIKILKWVTNPTDGGSIEPFPRAV